jgi:hypothetical protein
MSNWTSTLFATLVVSQFVFQCGELVYVDQSGVHGHRDS